MLSELICDAFDPTKMNCALVVKNLKTGESAAWNENRRVPSASLIKLPIMVEVMRQARAGRLSLEQRISVASADKVPFSILTLLETGNSYSLRDLITLMIIQSDNTAANLLIDRAGSDRINQGLAQLGLPGTVLQRKMMDSAARAAGRENFTTAADMARLLELLYRGAVVDAAGSAWMLEIMKNQLNNSMMMQQLPDDTVVAHKTGDLAGISHDVGIVYREDFAYILAVLVWDARTNCDARLAIGRISRAVYDYFETKRQPATTGTL